MVRLPMNMVPLSPMTMVRAPGWPLDQTSILKPDGSLILSSGSLASGVTVGDTGCGERSAFWPLLSTLVWSIGLKPGGPARTGAGTCWASASVVNSAKPAATNKPRWVIDEMDMRSSPDAEVAGLVSPDRPAARLGFLARSVGQVAPHRQSGFGRSCR